MLKKAKLQNGLKLLFVPDKNFQTVTFLLMVKTGSKYEKREERGISHFLEHMHFKGTKKRKTPKEVSEVLDKIGGIYNASTSQELTVYWCKVRKNHWDLALDWLSDIILNSYFPEKELEKEKGVIVEELKMRKDHPMVYVEDLWYKLLYGDQPAGWEIIGTEESIKKMKREMFFEYKKEQYVPNNMLFVAAGNFSEKEVKKKIEKYFGRQKKGICRKKEKVIEHQSSPQVLLEKRELDQTHLFLGFRGANLFSKERWSQEVLATLLGGMMSSRLFVEIREKMGIAYYVSAEPEENPDTGFLACRAGLKNEKAKEGIENILKEFKKILEGKIEKEELKKAKENLKGKLAISLESPESKAAFFAQQELLEGKIVPIEKIFEKIDRVSIKELVDFAKKYFKKENLNLALISPLSEKKEFEKILEKF